MGEGGSALQELESAASALLQDVQSVAADEETLLGFLIPLRTQINRCELAFSEGARRLVPLQAEDLASDLSPIQLLRYECKMATGAAVAAVQVGEQAERLPESRRALEEGRIGFAHLNLIAQTAEFVGEGFSESWLLRKAEKSHVTGFARICAHARHAANPEKFAQQEESLHQARFLELTTRAEDGAVFLRGLLDAEGGAHLRTAVEGLAQKLPDDDRTAGQRRADAVVEMSRLALDEGRLPEQGGVRPHLQVTASLETLLGRPGAPAAELEGSGPISVEALRRIAGDCSLRRLLLDEESMVIDVGRERRLFRGASRVALEVRDKGCVWPGCTRAARHCQADHAVPWWLGGPSDAGNGRLLCRYHHRLRSEGWELIPAEDSGAGSRCWLAKPPLWAIRPEPDG